MKVAFSPYLAAIDFDEHPLNSFTWSQVDRREAAAASADGRLVD